jgi:large subunit ribosomal protein L32
MAVPNRKISRARKGNRAANKGLKRPSLSYCPRCDAAKPPHRICPNCGQYAGRDAVRQEK